MQIEQSSDTDPLMAARVEAANAPGQRSDRPVLVQLSRRVGKGWVWCISVVSWYGISGTF
jgi:hypothetical protein